MTSPQKTPMLCAICGEHANEHGSIGHVFTDRATVLADCAPVAGERREIRCTGCAMHDEPCIYCAVAQGRRDEPSPSKRDATEVRLHRCKGYECTLQVLREDFVTESDHTAAIQASLAREAALRSQLPEGMEHCTIKLDTCAKCERQWLQPTNWINHGCPHCASDDERAANVFLRSRLAAVEAERDIGAKDRAIANLQRELSAARKVLTSVRKRIGNVFVEDRVEDAIACRTCMEEIAAAIALAEKGAERG